MRNRWRLALLVAAACVSTPVAAQVQNDTGIKTETEERRSGGGVPTDTIWNLLGLLGLFGLVGVWRSTDNDGYTGDPI